MSDADRILAYLDIHGSITSYEIRVKALSGDPSARIGELIDRGHEIDIEHFRREGRPCARYTLVGAGSSTPKNDVCASRTQDAAASSDQPSDNGPVPAEVIQVPQPEAVQLQLVPDKPKTIYDEAA